MKKVVLVDLDGTIADTSHRYNLAPTVDQFSTWSVYAKACIRDTVIESVAVLTRILISKCEIHYISGRDGSALLETEMWLRKNNLPYHFLTLRPAGNEDSNADIKVNYILKLRAEGKEPILLLDDWPDTCRAAESVGVPALRVGNMGRLEPDGGNTFSGVVVLDLSDYNV
jgi:hypothetical protein